MTKHIFSPHAKRTNLFGRFVASCIRSRRTLQRFMLGALTCSAIACSIDQQGLGFSGDPATVLQDVETEYQSYNLSQVQPYDTVTIHARGVSGAGATIDAPIVYGYNAKYVTIDSDGRLKAVAPISSTLVTLTMTFGGITIIDTVMVSVISAAPQQLRRFAIEMNAGDSAKVAAGGPGFRATKPIHLIREGMDGSDIRNVLVSLRSSDAAIATIAQSANNVTVTGVRPGRVTLYASTYAYGVGMRDSLSFLVGWPLGGFVGSYSRYDSKTREQVLDFKGGNFTVGMGSCIIWINYDDTHDLDVVFEDPTHVYSADSVPPEVATTCKSFAKGDTMSNGRFAGGNVLPWRKVQLPNGNFDYLSQLRARVFKKAGVYRYRSSYGTTGVITVCDEQNDSTCSPENYHWGVVKP